MMGERKTIYVPDGLWGKIVSMAEAQNISASQLLLNPWVEGESQLDRIEKKIDSLRPNAKAANPEKYPSHRPEKPNNRSQNDGMDMSEDQLKEIQEEAMKRNKKKTKIPGAIKTKKEAAEWAGGFSKERQLGKK